MDNNLCPEYNLNKIFENYNPQQPTAFARIRGGQLAPCIKGNVFFYQLNNGVYVRAFITGISDTNINGEVVRFHGFHIHNSGDCSIGVATNPFPNTGQHYNPSNNNHPLHAGDLPPILVSDGVGILSFYTTYFSVSEIINKSVVIHDGYDDFTTQPSGNSGFKIACGRIIAYNK